MKCHQYPWKGFDGVCVSDIYCIKLPDPAVELKERQLIDCVVSLYLCASQHVNVFNYSFLKH